MNIIELKHTHNLVPAKVYFGSTLPLLQLNKIVAYLQFKLDDLQHGFDLDEQTLREILIHHYDAVPFDTAYPIYSIDLYVMWERWCSEADTLKQDESLHRPGLDDYLEILVKEGEGVYE